MRRIEASWHRCLRAYARHCAVWQGLAIRNPAHTARLVGPRCRARNRGGTRASQAGADAGCGFPVAAAGTANGAGKANGTGKANGAGIAADPTLTDAWASGHRVSCGKPPDPHCSEHAWRPMSSPGAHGLAASHWFRDLSPALAPASGFCLRCSGVWSEHEALSVRCRSPCLAETTCPWRLETSATYRPEPSPAAFFNQARSLSGNTVSRSPQGWSACLWPKPCACRLAKRAGTGITAILET
jgi:hypothetical protein